MSKSVRDVIATTLQSALKGEGGIRNVPQTCLADAILAALAAAGKAVVDIEATEAMIVANRSAPRVNDPNEQARIDWRAMLKASPQ